jgi:hypothetical protein
MIDAVYDDFNCKFKDDSYVCSQATVSPTNDAVGESNSAKIEMVPGEGKTYLSFDNISKCSNKIGDVDLL